MFTRIAKAITRHRELRTTEDALLERDEDYWDVIQPQRQEELQKRQTTIECPRCGGTGRLGTFTHLRQGDW